MSTTRVTLPASATEVPPNFIKNLISAHFVLYKLFMYV
jgi:hypothetical protein